MDLTDLIKYQNLSRWKYRTVEACLTDVGIILYESGFESDGWRIGVGNDYIELDVNGVLMIKPNYCWDGASGPTYDSKNTMRGSLIHDALYQLIREGLLPLKFRKQVDQIFRTIIREDGMGRFRASYYYRAVRMFGGSAAKPRKRVDDVLEAP